jgi:hypothetical protein
VVLGAGPPPRWEREGIVSTDADGFTLKNMAALRKTSEMASVGGGEVESLQANAASR